MDVHFGHKKPHKTGSHGNFGCRKKLTLHYKVKRHEQVVKFNLFVKLSSENAILFIKEAGDQSGISFQSVMRCPLAGSLCHGQSNPHCHLIGLLNRFNLSIQLSIPYSVENLLELGTSVDSQLNQISSVKQRLGI